MAEVHETVILLDVDNTLLDNDSVERELRSHLKAVFGDQRAMHYWDIFEELRADLGYADYLGALQRYRIEHPRDPSLLTISLFLVHYPFDDRLYPDALDVIGKLKMWAPVVILTDGDVVFQPRKVERSGLWEAVDGNVLIYIHKEQMLDDVAARYPARRYIMVDDKIRILAAMKQLWGDRLTTVFPRQGHYAHDAETVASHPPADISIDRISDLLVFDFAALTTAAMVTRDRRPINNNK
jgi:FMN phosphatase YigB (HAD superfamily)